MADEKDKVHKDKARAALSALVNAGVDVRTIRCYAIHHDKVIVADGETVELGSFNYSDAAAHKNSENVLVDWGNTKLAEVYPSGLNLTYSYDSYGCVSKIASNLSGTWATLADSFLYQPATDRLYSWRFGNGLPRSVTLDTDGRVTNLFGNTAQSMSFNYYTDNTIQSRSGTTYAYDADQRLKTVSGAGALSWTLDLNGNPTATSGSSAMSIVVDPASNRLSSMSGRGQWRNFTYDGAGNTKTDTWQNGSRSYEYDRFNRLNKVSAGSTVLGSYLSNALNQRVRKTTSSKTSVYVMRPMADRSTKRATPLAARPRRTCGWGWNCWALRSPACSTPATAIRWAARKC